MDLTADKEIFRGGVREALGYRGQILGTIHFKEHFVIWHLASLAY